MERQGSYAYAVLDRAQLAKSRSAMALDVFFIAPTAIKLIFIVSRHRPPPSPIC